MQYALPAMRDLLPHPPLHRCLPSVFALASALLLAACGPAPENEPAEEPIATEPAAAEAPLFEDATEATGLDFVHFNGMSGELYFCEMVGPGAALLDYDLDGDLDLFLVQGSMLGDRPIEEATFPPRHALPLSDRLYRNDPGPEGPRFTDVTAESGLAALGTASYGMGVASGDYDNDGRPDLYVTGFGANRLLRNAGPGADGRITFEDVTEASGADDPRWSVSATFADIDRDGWLDLYVGNYVSYTLATHKRCRAATGAPDYCGPLSYPPQTDRLLRNLGPGEDGTVRFEDISRRSGIEQVTGGALGVVAADFDRDGWLDLYVANDGVANQMWINAGDGTFTDQALLGGSALNQDGHPEAGMGVDAGDFDNDGDEDLFLSHLDLETNTLYRSAGDGRFEDVTTATGLGPPSWEATGFGTAFLDFDNDGLLDLFVLNGAVKVVEELAREGDPHPLHQENQLFHNLGGGRFVEVTDRAGSAFEPSEVSRGAAVGDLDNDGDADLVLGNNAGPARILLNRVGSENAWLGLRLLDGGRDALGAWVEVVRDGAPSLWRRVSSGGGYASARDPRVLFGLGERGGAGTAVREVRVTWPGGAVERFAVPGIDRYSTLERGQGEAP
jgi:hypothetical protein